MGTPVDAKRNLPSSLTSFNPSQAQQLSSKNPVCLAKLKTKLLIHKFLGSNRRACGDNSLHLSVALSKVSKSNGAENRMQESKTPCHPGGHI